MVAEASKAFSRTSRFKGASGRWYTRPELEAEGGMGALYRLRHRENTFLAKFAKPGSGRILSRELAINLAIVPNSVDGFAQLVDWGVYRTQHPFVVFEYVDGISLESYPPQSLLDVVNIIVQLSKNVSLLHSSGFVHGDISPRNVIINGSEEPVLIDFGLSAPTGRIKLGETKSFTAPENDLTPASDVYSLGKLTEELVSRLEKRDQQLWQVFRSSVPAIAQASEGDPQLRTPSANAFQSALEIVVNKLTTRVITVAEFPLEGASSAPAWMSFTDVASSVSEYLDPIDFPDAPDSARVVMPEAALENAAFAYNLIERNDLELTHFPTRLRSVGNFCWAYATQLAKNGKLHRAAVVGMRSVDFFSQLSLTRTDELELSRRLGELSKYYASTGESTTAVALLYWNVTIRRRVESADSPLVAQALNNLSGCLRVLMNAPSTSLLIQAKNIWRQAFGDANNEVAWADHNIGRLLSQSGSTDLAISTTRSSLNLKQSLLGEYHPQAGTVALNLAEQYSRQNDRLNADRYFALALKIRDNTIGFFAFNTLSVVNSWVKSLITSGQWQQAYSLLSSRFCRSTLNVMHEDVRTFLELLTLVCKRLGRRHEAKKYEFLRSGFAHVIGLTGTPSYGDTLLCASQWLSPNEVNDTWHLLADAIRMDEKLSGDHKYLKSMLSSI